MNNILEDINNSTLKFLVPLTLEEVYKAIIKESVKLVKAKHAAIFLAQNGKLSRVAASSPVLLSYKPRKNGNLVKAFKRNIPYIADASSVTSVHPELKVLNIKSILHIPLPYGKKAIGMLTVYTNKMPRFTKSEFKILKLFGAMASLAIRKTQLYDETKRALELRDQFISLASHELRTPLTSINGYTQLLHLHVLKSNSQEARWIKSLYPETVRLTNLIKELLDVNKIATGKFDYELKECSLVEIINRALDNIRFSYADRKIIFENGLAKNKDKIIGDHDKILQVIDNMLDNAIKFTPIDKEVKLKIESSSNFFKVTVEDQGEGIGKTDVPKVFDRYYKGSNNLKQGMGLGLSLIKSIIEAHKGKVEIQSERGIGTKIEVKLPRSM